MENSVPKHIAIIPDGNRRWAKKRGKDPWDGHEAGAQNIERLVRYALKRNIECISFWGSSLENLTKRSLRERSELLSIYETYFEKLKTSDDIHSNKVRINVIGRWRDQFPQSLQRVIDGCIEVTKQYEERQLNFFLAYSGDDEMLSAVRAIAQEKISEDKIDANVIKAHLMTHMLPPVDYLIRTGGEPHLSVGFMMWDIANAQLYFSEKFFPDFDDSALGEALDEYAQRQRRHGN